MANQQRLRPRRASEASRAAAWGWGPTRIEKCSRSAFGSGKVDRRIRDAQTAERERVGVGPRTDTRPPVEDGQTGQRPPREARKARGGGAPDRHQGRPSKTGGQAKGRRAKRVKRVGVGPRIDIKAARRRRADRPKAAARSA